MQILTYPNECQIANLWCKKSVRTENQLARPYSLHVCKVRWHALDKAVRHRHRAQVKLDEGGICCQDTSSCDIHLCQSLMLHIIEHFCYCTDFLGSSGQRHLHAPKAEWLGSYGLLDIGFKRESQEVILIRMLAQGRYWELGDIWLSMKSIQHHCNQSKCAHII